MSKCLNQVINDIKNDYEFYGNWRAVSDKYEVNVKYVYDLAMHGKEPSNAIVRHKLGLPQITAIVVVVGDGLIPPGTQVSGSRPCVRCGKPYAPNTATRRYCFTCHKVRMKK